MPVGPAGEMMTSAVAGTVLAATVVVTCVTAGAAAPAQTRLAGTVGAVPDGTAVLGPSDGSTRLTVDVALRPRDPIYLVHGIPRWEKPHT